MPFTFTDFTKNLDSIIKESYGQLEVSEKLDFQLGDVCLIPIGSTIDDFKGAFRIRRDRIVMVSGVDEDWISFVEVIDAPVYMTTFTKVFRTHISFIQPHKFTHIYFFHDKMRYRVPADFLYEKGRVSFHGNDYKTLVSTRCSCNLNDQVINLYAMKLRDDNELYFESKHIVNSAYANTGTIYEAERFPLKKEEIKKKINKKNKAHKRNIQRIKSDFLRYMGARRITFFKGALTSDDIQYHISELRTTMFDAISTYEEELKSYLRIGNE